jgi:hypothetical protein
VLYWASDFNWVALQAALNELPQFIAHLSGGARGCDLVIPSLPGFPLSERSKAPVSARTISADPRTTAIVKASCAADACYAEMHVTVRSLSAVAEHSFAHVRSYRGDVLTEAISPSFLQQVLDAINGDSC